MATDEEAVERVAQRRAGGQPIAVGNAAGSRRRSFGISPFVVEIEFYREVIGNVRTQHMTTARSQSTGSSFTRIAQIHNGVPVYFRRCRSVTCRFSWTHQLARMSLVCFSINSSVTE